MRRRGLVALATVTAVAWSTRPTEELVGGVLASAEYRARLP